MEVALTGAAFSATISVVLKQLDSLSVEEIGHLWNFSNNLQKLKDSLLMIKDFLEDAEINQVSKKPVQRWLMRLEAEAFNADYVFDQLHYQLLRKQVRTGQKMKEKVSSFFSKSNPIVFRYNMARKINSINKKLKSINEEANDLGLQMTLSGTHPREAPAYLETDSFTVNQVFVGREKDVAKIVSLVTTAPTEQLVSVLSIVGMGGLGKTILARKVFNDVAVKSHFVKRVWVHVSQNSFEPVAVLKSVVASSMGEQNVDGSREVLLQKLQTSLGNQKYLLVLDNVWNESNAKWDSLVASLKGISENVKGNVIMITTRSENVASIVTTMGIEKLGDLSKQDCWLIIKAYAFRGESTPQEFETIGANIAKKCGGLPLAAQTVGSLLHGKSKEEWVCLERNWLSSYEGEGNTVTEILKLSYDHLSSSSLKKCFAFYSLIPKDWWIEKDEMIQLWMAEGYLQTDDEANMEIEGNRVFNLLVQSSLFQVWGRDSLGHVQRFGMHDLVHDLSSSALNPKFLDSTCKVRYISRTFANESPPIAEEDAKSLRALFFEGKASQIIFSHFRRLHVLILIDAKMSELPSEIRNLICLRYLDISRTKIKVLPDSIVNLYHLQTLTATKESAGQSYLSNLPHKFEYLVNLRHLYIPNIKLPPNIGKLTSLQTLTHFQVGDEEGCGIAELGSLKNLKGKIEIHNLEKVHHKEEARKAHLFHKPNILKLKLEWDDEARENNESSDKAREDDENVLEGLQPHPNLKSLEIKGFKGSSFPLWTMRMEVRDDVEDRWIRLDNLVDIKLSSSIECKEIPMMGHLRCLKYIYLHHLWNVESIGSSFYGFKEDDVNKDLFPALEKLELIGMKNLNAWTEVELSNSSRTQPPKVSVFPRLEYLKIVNCQELKIAPSHFPCLKELVINGMESGLPLARICGSKLTTLKKLKISEVDGIVSLPDGLFNNNRDLLELVIRNCHKLTHLVPSCGGGGASLKNLEIFHCSSFERLPEDVHKLNALEVLSIRECGNLKSIAYPTGGESSMVQGFTSLQQLKIIECRGLKNLPLKMIESCAVSLERLDLKGSINMGEVISYLHKMSRLKSLNIKGVPILCDVVLEIGCLGSIENLEIGGCGDYVSFKESVDHIFPAFTSLRELWLYGKEEWDGLPDQLQHLTNLYTLWLHEFGMQGLPEWLERLSSLRLLVVSNCKELRHVASKKAMRGHMIKNILCKK